MTKKWSENMKCAWSDLEKKNAKKLFEIEALNNQWSICFCAFDGI